MVAHRRRSDPRCAEAPPFILDRSIESIFASTMGPRRSRRGARRRRRLGPPAASIHVNSSRAFPNPPSTNEQTFDQPPPQRSGSGIGADCPRRSSYRGRAGAWIGQRIPEKQKFRDFACWEGSASTNVGPSAECPRFEGLVHTEEENPSDLIDEQQTDQRDVEED